MVKRVKCGVCGKEKTTEAKQFFKCCNVAQPITEENWLNKPQTNTPKEEVASVDNSQSDNKTPEIVEEKSEMDEHGKEEAGENLNETPDNSSLDVVDVHEEEEKIIKGFEYQCGECNSYFNELNNGCCPVCDAELEQMAYKQELSLSARKKQLTKFISDAEELNFSKKIITEYKKQLADVDGKIKEERARRKKLRSQNNG